MAAGPRGLSFGALAAAYERARPDWPLEAARWLAPGGPGPVVELGAGTGKLTRALAALGLRVLALEPDPRMLAVLRAHAPAGVEAVEGAAEAIPLGDGVAGAVVAGSSFHWFRLEEALSEAHRVLRPGGTLALAWNHRDRSHRGMDAVGREIEAARGGHADWPDRPWAERLTAGGLFAGVEGGRFPHVHLLPRSALRDHLRSYSTIARLPEERQEELVRRVGAIVEREPGLRRGDDLALPFVVEGYRAIRTSGGRASCPSP